MGTTVLAQAADGGYLATVRVLLAHGADVRVRDDDGLTALKYASGANPFGNKSPAVADALKRAGATQ